MDNIVFKKNYEKPTENSDYCCAVFDQALDGGFFRRYCDMMKAIPKIIVPKDKENYEYLLNRCDQYAQKHYGRIYAVVDYNKWHSEINLYLPMLEFDDETDMSLLRDIGEKAHYVNISQESDGTFHLYIMVNYFEEVISEEEKGYIQYKAIEQDEKLASMLHIPQLSSEDQVICQRMNKLLDRFDKETNVDRTTAFKVVFEHMMAQEPNNQPLEYMEVLLEQLLGKLLADEKGEDLHA